MTWEYEHERITQGNMVSQIPYVPREPNKAAHTYKLQAVSIHYIYWQNKENVLCFNNYAAKSRLWVVKEWGNKHR
jgi:hypothetical protein